MNRSETFDRALMEFFAPLQGLFEDPAVSEIVLNGPAQIYAEERGRMRRVEISLPREDLLGALRVVAQYAGRSFDAEHPILEAHLPNGARLEAVLEPIAADGPCVAIRKHQSRSFAPDDLIRHGSISLEAMNQVTRYIQQKKNVLVSGGTGSGKTSLLSCFAGLLEAHERILILEDAREIRIEHPHVVSLETRPADARGRGALTMADLLRATLRLRPDRIVIGEVRGGEALDLVQAMSTGHGGCLSTIHASSPAGALRRLETLAASRDVTISFDSLRRQVAHAIEVVVQTERLPDGRRGVVEIAEVLGLDDSGEYRVRSIFYRSASGTLERPGGEPAHAR